MTRNYIRLLVFTVSILLALLTACAEKKSDADSESKETYKAEKIAKEQNDLEFPKAADNFEEMMVQPHGQLMKEIIKKDLDGKYSWDAQPYFKYYRESFKESSEKTITEFIKKYKEISDDRIYDYLIYMVGSGQYQSYYDQLKNFDGDFKAPDLPTGPDGKDQNPQTTKKTNIIVLLDASGSMNQSVPGGKKIDLAKNAITHFVSSLPKETNISLLVYGHVGSGSDADKAKSCSKIDTVYPLNRYLPGKFQSSFNQFKASGWTPLAGAMDQAKNILSKYNSQEYDNRIYIVSDGIETCDGDPIKSAKNLQDKNIKATVNIIGFDVDNAAQNQLKQVAKAGNGEFIKVQNKTELESQIQKKWSPSIIELYGKQAVNPFDMLEARKEIIHLQNTLLSLSDNEKNRLDGVIHTLYNEKLINDATREALLNKAEDMYEIRNNEIKNLQNTKEQELQKLQQKYQKQIDDWRKQWE